MIARSLITSTLFGTLAFATTVEAAPLDDDRIADVAESTMASVVNISTTQDAAPQMGPMAFDPFFNDPRSPFYVDPEMRKAQSLGSGVIITASGRILTNAHVVGNAEDIKVTLSDGVDYSAKLVGADPRSDLAVVQLEGKFPRLQPVTLGDSSKLRLGEVVIAIGNPFGVGQAVTMGIVSAKGRASVGIVEYEDFIQTDAAINPGNSGGALINLHGELVGINTAILSRTGGYQGIGFAIPTNMARPIVDMLVKDGKVTRGFLGVNIATLNQKLAAERKINATEGVLVTDVMANGPAAKAGIKDGDVMVQLDGDAVKDAGHLRNQVAIKGAGASVELVVLRKGQRVPLRIKLGELPEQAKTRQMPQRRRIR